MTPEKYKEIPANSEPTVRFEYVRETNILNSEHIHYCYHARLNKCIQKNSELISLENSKAGHSYKFFLIGASSP